MAQSIFIQGHEGDSFVTYSRVFFSWTVRKSGERDGHVDMSRICRRSDDAFGI